MIAAVPGSDSASEMKSSFQEELGEHLSDYLHLLIDEPKQSQSTTKQINIHDLSDFLLPPPSYEESMAQRQKIISNLPPFASSFTSIVPTDDVAKSTVMVSSPASPASVSSGIGSSLGDGASLSPPTPTSIRPFQGENLVLPTSNESAATTSSNVVLPVSNVQIPTSNNLALPVSNAQIPTSNNLALPVSNAQNLNGQTNGINLVLPQLLPPETSSLMLNQNNMNFAPSCTQNLTPSSNNVVSVAVEELQASQSNHTTKSSGPTTSSNMLKHPRKTTQLAGKKRPRQTLSHFNQTSNLNIQPGINTLPGINILPEGKGMIGANILKLPNILAGSQPPNGLPTFTGANQLPVPKNLNAMTGPNPMTGSISIPGSNPMTVPNNMNLPQTHLIHRMQQEQQMRNQQISLDVNSLYHENIALKESVRQLVRQRTQLQQQLNHYKGLVEMSVKNII